MRALVFRSAYSASRNARASAAFAASIKAHCAVSSETLMLQVRCANPPMPHRTSSLSCSGVPVGLLSYLRAIPPFGALAFRSAYWLSLRHPAFRRAGVPFGLLAISAPSRLSARWRSVRLIGCLRTIPPYGVLAFRSAYWLRQTLELQSLRDLRQAQTPNSSRFATYGKLKRSTSRFASLTLRLRTEMLLRNIPVFRMAYWDQRAHRAL